MFCAVILMMTIASLLSGRSVAFAQVTVDATFGLASTVRNISGVPADEETDDESSRSLRLGVSAWSRVASRVDVGLGAALVSRGYEYEERGFDWVAQYQLREPYLSIPVSGRFWLAGDGAFAVAGVSTDVYLASDEYGARKRLLLGGHVGLGLRWSRFTLQGNYSRDLTPSFRIEQEGVTIEEKFDTYSVLLGVTLLGHHDRGMSKLHTSAPPGTDRVFGTD